jgi:hypothetical protein
VKKKTLEQSMTELAEAAFKQAAKKILKRALDTGTPLILWANGEVMEVDPRTVQANGRRRRPRKASS